MARRRTLAAPSMAWCIPVLLAILAVGLIARGGTTDDATTKPADGLPVQVDVEPAADSKDKAGPPPLPADVLKELVALVKSASLDTPEPTTAPGDPAELSVTTELPDASDEDVDTDVTDVTDDTDADAADEAADDSADEGGDLIQVSRPGVFMVNFQNTDLRLALRLLSTQGRRNIVASKSVTGTVTATFYDVTFQEALDAILQATGFGYIERENFIYVYSAEEIEKIKKASQPLELRTFRLSYVRVSDVQVLILPAMSSDGTVAVTPTPVRGIAPDTTETGGNDFALDDLLVVRDYAKNLDQIAEIIAQVDVRPQQVLIEATILTARLDETNSLGVNFAALQGVNFDEMGAGSTGIGDMATGALAAGDTRVRAAAFRTDFDIVDDGLTVGFLSSNVAVFISALETFTDVTVLANPKLLILNKQRGEVLIGSRDGYLTTVVNEGISTESVEFLETGTKLIVRPFIGNDGYIRLEIHPEDSDGSVVNGLPNETTTQVTSNVLVRDGHTIVIGGLFRDEVQEGRSQIPGLGNLKHIGEIFAQTDDVVERHEVIIVITTHIIRQDADEAISEQIKDDIERFRVGQRKGLRWWGRAQLAQTCLRRAHEALVQGRLDRALWNTDMALSLHPRFIEAIRLKERMTEQAYWAQEGRTSSVKYVLQRMIMEDLHQPVSRVIVPRKPLDGIGLSDDVRDAIGIRPILEDPLPGVGNLPGNEGPLPGVGNLPGNVLPPGAVGQLKDDEEQADENNGAVRVSPNAKMDEQ
ncbi:hypothetical protein LCGC14_0321030 [marine sediment metagenome]|uniref:Secretin/TonB short N-terminal domain-containing protein n=1 Tax=marine sediment metagenome TaxID=412755 RepID=A0A0F9W6I2_9ZZZZ